MDKTDKKSKNDLLCQVCNDSIGKYINISVYLGYKVKYDVFTDKYLFNIDNF